jgi:hypothetical protein
MPDRTVHISRPRLEAKVEKALLGLHAAPPDSGYASEFRMERANMQPGSAERHAGFDHPSAELVKKLAIASEKAGVLH